MSAIFGILRFDGAPVNPRDLVRMGNTLAHRGPDGRKSSVDGSIGLGHCLLRVNEEDRFEAQPLTDRDADLTLVADVRIDNREELAGAFGLSAADTREMPDSQFVLRAYKTWGEAAPEHLIGDFVFAIWDAGARKLVLARDHMGQRQLLFHRGDRQFVFATTEAALWAVEGVPRAISDRHFAKMLLPNFDREPGSTMFEGISGICGGSVMTVAASGEIAARQYWTPQASPVHLGQDRDYYRNVYRKVLQEAVECRLRRTRHPAGILFSGGFDSAALAGLSAPVMCARKQKVVAVCSADIENHDGAIEPAMPRVEACRRHMPGVDFRYVAADHFSVTRGLDRWFVEFGMPAGIGFLLFADLHRALAAEGVRVVFNGDGGDVTLNPMDGKALARWLKAGRLARFVSEFRAWRRHRKRSFLRVAIDDVLLAMVPPEIEDAVSWVRLGLPLFKPRMPVTPYVAELAAVPVSRSPDSRRVTHAFDRKGQLYSILCRVQREALGSSWSIPPDCPQICTRPFYDKRVIELALAIPIELQTEAGKSRALARAALGDILPPEFAALEKGSDPGHVRYPRVFQRVEAQVMGELSRLENQPRLAKYIDFKGVARLLPAARRNSASAVAVLRSLMMARYIEWFAQGNRTHLHDAR